MSVILRTFGNVIKDIVYFLQVDAVNIMVFGHVVQPDGSLPCPMCKLEFPPMPEGDLKDFNFDDYNVTMPNGDDVSFKDATLGHLEDNFPDIKTSSYTISAAFDFDQDDRLDFAITDREIEEALKPEVHRQEVNECKGKEGQKQHEKQRRPKKMKGPRTLPKIKEDRKQKLAVEKMAQTIYTLGKKHLEPMFVLSEFKFENFLRKVKIPKKEKQLVTVFDGDHDIAVISLQKGIIFVQVKSVERVDGQSAWNAIKRAFEQVLKDVPAMKTMNRDLNFIKDLPMYGFVAIPNISNEQLDSINICKTHRRLILTASDLSEDNFTVWLSRNISCRKSLLNTLVNTIRKVGGSVFNFMLNRGQIHNVEYAMSLDDYKLLCSRYAGPASIIKFRTLSEAIIKVGGRVSRIMLNSEQNQCLEQNRKLNILLGDYGTGKSIVLMKQAENVATKYDELVYVISFSVVSAGSGKVQEEDDNLVVHLENMMKSNKYETTKLKVMSFLEFLRHVGKCDTLKFPQQTLTFPFQLTPDILCELMETTLSRTGNAHFFFDEVPLCLGSCKKGWSRFEEFCEKHKSVFVWISVATGSFSLTRKDTFESLYNFLPLKFSKTILKRCMRTTVNNFELLKAVRMFKADGLCNEDLTFHGNFIHGPRPIWLEMGPCSCEEMKDPYKCYCVERRLEAVIEYTLRKVKNIDCKDVTILLHDTSLFMTKFLAKVVENVCKVLVGGKNYNFKVSSLGDKRSHDVNSQHAGLTVVDLWSFKGNESKVVIFVDAYGGPVVWTIESLWHGWVDISIAVSRSVAHFVFVTWPLDEQRYFLHHFADCLAKGSKETEDEMIRKFYAGIAETIENGRHGHFWETKNFMDYLVSKGVLEKIHFNRHEQ